MTSMNKGENAIEQASHLERHLALWLLVVVLMGGVLGFCVRDLVAVNAAQVCSTEPVT